MLSHLFAYLAILATATDLVVETPAEEEVIDGQMYHGTMMGVPMMGVPMMGVHHPPMPMAGGRHVGVGYPMGGGYGGRYGMPGRGSHGNYMNNHGGGYGSSTGQYNQGNNYSNRSGWDRGYNHTDSNSYNQGSQNQHHGNQRHNSHGSHGMHYLRRLESEPVDELTGTGTDDPTVEENLSGQGYYGVHGGMLTPHRSSALYPYGGGISTLPHYTGGYGGVHGGLMNQNQQYAGNQYGGSQGQYNQGNTYSNRSGWDRGYDHTDSNSYNTGAHNNQTGHHYNSGTALANNILNTIYKPY